MKRLLFGLAFVVASFFAAGSDADTYLFCIDCVDHMEANDELSVTMCYLDDEYFALEGYHDRLLEILQDIQREINALLDIPEHLRFSSWDDMMNLQLSAQRDCADALIANARRMRKNRLEYEACEDVSYFRQKEIWNCTTCDDGAPMTYPK